MPATSSSLGFPNCGWSSFISQGLASEATMKRVKLDSVAVFLLFFGVATLEAFQTHNWIKAAFWLAIGCVFLIAGNVPKTA